MTTRLSYEGFAYKQSEDPDAPWIINMVIPAEELLQWAGIPRRVNENMIGFQRVDDEPRVRKAKEFFEKGINQSPTALVVGIHPTDNEEKLIKLELEDSDNPGIKKCKLEIVLPIDFNETDDVDTVVAILKRQIQYRIISQEEISGDEEEEVEESQEDQAVPNDASEDDVETQVDNNYDEDAQEEPEVELGMSKLQLLLEKLEDTEWCKQNLKELRDLAKPATIIDGQHRVKGAELCERNIPFTVCAVYDCPWSEQVFQFTVVNYTAKGIPDQFITANAALSLTKLELGKLQERLVQAGVKVKEHELMQIVQWDRQSPFYELVNLTEKKDAGKIGYKTMVSVAKAWYDGKDNAIEQLIQSIYPDIVGKGSKITRLTRWKTEHWGLFFIEFWNTVYKKYKDIDSNESGYTLWSVGHSNLMKAVVLKELQAAFLTNLAAQSEEFFVPRDPSKALQEMKDKVSSRANAILGYIPPGFLAIEWKTKGLDTGPGRLALREAFRTLIDKKGGYQYQKSSLITGATN